MKHPYASNKGNLSGHFSIALTLYNGHKTRLEEWSKFRTGALKASGATALTAVGDMTGVVDTPNWISGSFGIGSVVMLGLAKVAHDFATEAADDIAKQVRLEQDMAKNYGTELPIEFGGTVIETRGVER